MAIPIDDNKRKRGKLLTLQEAAEYLGLAPATLEQWRSQRKGPAYFKLEKRLVRYASADLDDWLSAQRVSTQTLKKGS